MRRVQLKKEREKEKEREKQREKENENVDLNDPVRDTYMGDQHTYTFDEEQEEPPIVDSYSPANGQSHQSTVTSGSRGTKRKAPMNDFVEAQLDKMTSGIGLVADALNKGNCISDQLNDVAKQQVVISERQVAAIEKRNEILQNSRPRVYSAAEVWSMLSELDLLQQFRFKCYEVLCNDDKKKELIFGVPPEIRLQVLFQMMEVPFYH
jgi:hypothetical protein